MVDFPWYMGMAPLLGWCLDAVVPTRRFDSFLPQAVERTAERMEFVLRNAFPEKPQQGGWALALWVGLSAWLLGWALTAGAWIVLGHYFAFAAWTLIFYLAFTVRGRARAALRIQTALNQEQNDVALAWLQFIGGEAPSNDTEAISAAGVRQIAQSVVRSAVLPLFWGLLLGAGGALAALTVQELAQRATDEGSDDPFWAPIRQLGGWLTVLPSWAALVCIQTTIAFAGGHRGATMAGFLNRFRDPPLSRVSSAVAYGLNLGKPAGGTEDGRDVTPRDLHRATIVLWTSTAFAAAATTVAAALLYHFIL